MIKNVHYITISAFFIFALFLFLIFNPDSHAVNMTEDSDIVITKSTDSKLDKNAEIAVIIRGDSDTPIIKNIKSTLSFLRLEYIMCDSVYNVGSVGIIIYATSDVTETDIEVLQEFLTQGGNVIFATMPYNMTEEMMSFFEITEYIPDYKVEGFDIYDQILLESMVRTNDIIMNCAKVSLTGRCKVYANGHEPNRNKSTWLINMEDENPLIWRTYYEIGAIYVMNAPFMEDIYGTGILTGLLSFIYDDFIYPIVGTKTVILNNFPFLLDERIIINNRTPYAFARDIIWPNLYSIARRMDITYTCFANGDFTLNTESYDAMNFFMSELYKMRGEMGFNGDSTSVINNDMAFINKYFPGQAIKSFRTSNQTDININGMTAVIEDSWDGAFEWVFDTAVKLPVISGKTSDEHTSFRFLSILSAMGIVIHEIDIAPVFTDDVAWNNYSIDIAKNLSYLFKKCEYLESANIKKAAESVKNYLNLDMAVSNTKKSLTVSLIRTVGESTFMLRTEKTIDVAACVNCTVFEIEKGIYIVKSSDPDFAIYFE